MHTSAATYTLPARTIPVRNETDILVLGAGPAGFGAAVTAARLGKRVTLVEAAGMVGGMWTLGLLSPFFDTLHHDGLNRELRTRLAERNAWGGLWDISFNPTEMALLLDEIILESHIDLLLYTQATQPIVENGALRGVIVENKSGTSAIFAETIIDCTGDGDIAARAGIPFDMGRPQDGLCQPMTMMFHIGGLRSDYPRDDTTLWYRLLSETARAHGINPLDRIPFSRPAIIRLPAPGEALIQWTHIHRHSGIDADELTQATLEGRRQIRSAMELLRLASNDLGDIRLLSLPSVIGVRETRRIHGLYTISDDDVRQSRPQPDNVCTVLFNVDIHEPDNEGQTCLHHKGFDIPFRSLCTHEYPNHFVAGRCISGSHFAQAAYRVTGNCLAMGEGAAHHLCHTHQRRLPKNHP